MADERKRVKIRYDADHPIRIALDKLRTLDVVRIIGGKA
jgi:hypothetical protein